MNLRCIKRINLNTIIRLIMMVIYWYCLAKRIRYNTYSIFIFMFPFISAGYR
ncbi:Metalloprotease [Yersinia intermedia ATCC 29909]|nr:Metalloprotease [Yersinia intermedia ATCC 29909]